MQDNQTELEPTVTATDASCSCPSARDMAVTRFHQARAFAAAKVNQIRKAATEQADTIRDKAKHLHEASEEYVKEKPTQSMLIAMGVGLLIGLLIRRR